jgi:hypothetical protein
MEIFQTTVRKEDDGLTFLVISRSVGGFTPSDLGEGDERLDGEIEKSIEDDVSSAPTIRLRHKRSVSESSQLTNPLSNANSSPIMGKAIPTPTDKSHCYLFGYSIIEGENANQCQVQVLSQFSGSLQKLEIDHAFCRKLKQFIEELTMFTDFHTEQSDPKRAFSGLGEGKMRSKIVLSNNVGQFCGKYSTVFAERASETCGPQF